MSTTIHLPGDLLERVDKRAAELKLSRNRYIVQALQKSLGEKTAWSELFLETLAEAARDKSSHAMVEEMLGAIRRARRSRKGPEL